MLKILMAHMSKYSWAKASAPGHMGMGRRPASAAAGEVCGGVGEGGGGGARRPGGGGPCAQGHGPMPMCPGAKALAHEYFDIWAHKYF